ncbi:protein artemis [Centropristis striata]|uniref:protein artemis n=1 Tax=Centropristis striata TaxID=184440 RepID=UPI0027E1B1F7|nr:protein artemis [Centropristis striata]
MSSFAGRMKEYPTVSLDRFDRENLHARAYFLSHCHKDHMKGLKGPILKRKLQSCRTVRLYCSFVTKELLLSNPKYGFWEEYIVPLELESPTQISLVDEASGEKEEILITLLPAGHCPGSVMFLFEGSQGNVLYTGDFRLAPGDVSRIEHLHSGSRVKDIQTVYLDSTFYDPRFYQIPTREVCLNGISELIGSWINQSQYHVVWLNCKAAYGYEYLFTNLGEEFNTQIHVRSLAMFKKMPEILSYVTTDRRTQIHACRHPKDEEFFQGSRLPCGCTAPDGTPLRIISIKPSTMWFGERMKKTNVIIKTGASSFRACFSFHSSYSELKNFLSYLQPVNIYPSVIPIGRTLTDVSQMLKLMCRKQSDQALTVYKPLGVLKRSKMEQRTYDSDSDEGLFDGLDVAPVRKKIALNQDLKNGKAQSSQKTAPPVSVEESLPLNVTDTQAAAHNFVDCTESNDEDEGEEEEEEKQGEEEKELTKEEVKGTLKETEKKLSEIEGSSNPPKWEDFFTTEPLSDSQNSLNSQSQSCCSLPSPAPSRMTGSQTPELFSDEDETPDIEENFSLTLSGSLSNHSSQNQDSCLADTLILQPEQRGREQGDSRTNTASQEKTEESNVQSEQEELPDSQVSSDFDVPCTPESKIPQHDELSQLYRKLASGEEVVIRKGSQGST